MKIKESSDLIPFDFVADDYCISAYGDVVFAMEIEMKEVYTMSSSDSEEVGEVEIFYHDWKKSLSGLPEETIVQKISKFYSLPHKRNMSEGCKTKRWNEDMFIKRDVMFEKTYIVVSFQFSKGKEKKQLGGLMSRLNKFDGLESIGEYYLMFESFYESLKTSCKSVHKLGGWQILDLFVDIWNNGGNEDYLSDIEVTNSKLNVAGEYVKVLTSRKLPDTFNGFTGLNRKLTESDKLNFNNTDYRSDNNLPTSFLFPVGLGLPVDHIMVETIKIEDKDSVERKLETDFQRLNMLVGLKSSDAIKKRKEIEHLREDRTEYGYRYASWGVSIIVKSNDLDKLNSLTNYIVDVGLKQLGVVFAVESYGTWKQFYSSLPGCGRIANHLRLGFLEVVSYLTHVESFKKGNSKGMILVDLFGRPFVFDDWDENNIYCEARNGVVFAPTGQGKSFLINHVLDQAYWNGDFVFLIDVGGSYRRITTLNNGVYIDSKEINNLQFNPFLDCFSQGGEYYPELDSTGKKDAIYLDFMASLICACWYGSSGEEVSKEVYGAVLVTIKAYFKYVNANAVKDVNFDSYYHFVLEDSKNDEAGYKRFMDIDSFELLLKSFSLDGEYGFLLNAKESVKIDNRWITFDLVGILNNTRLTSPVLLIIMQMFQRIMNNWYGTNARMFIEEAVDFLQGGFFADYIGGLYRKIRKMGGQVFIVTQSIEFLDKLDPLVKSSILGNTEIKILLNHAKVSNLFDKMQRELSLSNSEMELLKNQTVKPGSKYRIGFMKFGSMPGFLFRHEVSPETFSLYQTNAKEIKKIDDLIESTGNVESAVKSYVEEN